MRDPVDPQQILAHLAQGTANRCGHARAFIQANEAALLAALRAGHAGSDIYQALVAAGHPPPMGLRQFRRYLARLRARVPSAVTTGPAPAPRPSKPALPVSSPATFRWDPLAEDEDIH